GRNYLTDPRMMTGHGWYRSSGWDYDHDPAMPYEGQPSVRMRYREAGLTATFSRALEGDFVAGDPVTFSVKARASNPDRNYRFRIWSSALADTVGSDIVTKLPTDRW